ncbi:MAG: phosphoglucosamine mutase [Kiritimatiellae bacterium]|nr:phosphoglucosamine mutase [Kiritimatiellia bacterium]
MKEVMKTLRLANFGIRGSIGDSLTPEVIIDFASAFGTFIDGGRLLVARDTRASSPMIHSAVISGFLSAGCDVIDFGICPTPILQHAVEKHQAQGAVSISGGHNRMGMNALTLIGSKGAYIEPVGGETVLDIYHARNFLKKDWDQLGSVSECSDYTDTYFDALEKHVDAEAIRKAGFTVLIDPVNGAGCRFIKSFAKLFGLKMVPINDDEDGHPAHDPEPRPRNARQVASLIPHLNADIGFVTSSDMGRLSFVCEDGRTPSEEYTFAVIANHVLKRQSGVVVTNCCTTRMVDDIARAHNATIVKTPVGQAYIISSLADEDGVIAGEGNGSVALPDFSMGCDAFLMMALTLESMAQNGRKISELIGELPEYHIVKKTIYTAAQRGYRALEIVSKNTQWIDNGKIDITDGIRVDWDDGWLHMRASHTEPMIRIASESTSKRKAENRAVTIARLLEQSL